MFPRALRWAQGILAGLAGLQVVVVLLFWTHRPEVTASWWRTHPEFTQDQIDNAVRETIYGSVAVHAAAAALYAWLALALPTRRRWMRRLTTASLAIGALAGYLFLENSSALIPSQVVGATTEQVLSLTLRLVALWLIWAPRDARAYFRSPVEA